MPHLLDNPIWESLQTHHRKFALTDTSIARYPRNIGPFAGIALDGATAPFAAHSAERAAPHAQSAHMSRDSAALRALLAVDELVYFLGVPPAALSDEFTMHAYDLLPQLVASAPIKEIVPGPEIIELAEAHRPDMIALTALVYPGYFRERTADIGGYIGIYQDGMLAAMAGERMKCHQYQEMSAICTHPNFLGRGYAARLLGALTNRTFERGFTPFLHVNAENTRARAVYDRLGYRERTRLPFVSVTRRKADAA